jgi:hypothetical protein
MQGKKQNILTCTDKITSFKKKLKLWGGRIKKKNKVETLELTKICRLNKNIVNLVLQNLSLLSKHIEKYFPSFDVSTLASSALYALESAELTAAEEDELTETRNDRRLKQKHSSTWPHSGCLSDRSTPSSQRKGQKYAFLSLHRVCVRLISLL